MDLGFLGEGDAAEEVGELAGGGRDSAEEGWLGGHFDSAWESTIGCSWGEIERRLDSEYVTSL